MLVPITYLSLKAAASVTLFLALSRPSVMYILTWKTINKQGIADRTEGPKGIRDNKD